MKQMKFHKLQIIRYLMHKNFQSTYEFSNLTEYIY